MVAAAATFLLSLAIVLGVYWLFIVRPEDMTVRKLRKRIQVNDAETPSREGLAKRRAPLSALKSLDAILSRSGRLIDPLRRAIEESGLTTTVGVVLLGSLFAATLTYAGIMIATSLLWPAVVAAVLSAGVPLLVVRVAANRRVRQFEEQFPQAIDLIASSLRAGH